MADQHDTGYDTTTTKLKEDEYELDYEGECLVFNPQKMLAAIQQEMAKDGKGHHIHGGVFVKNNGVYTICTIGEGLHPIWFSIETARQLLAHMEKQNNASSDNDKGESRKPDHLTMDPDKLAEQLVSGGSTRGLSVAFAILRRVGWQGPEMAELSKGRLSFSSGSPTKRNELQPKVPVDLKPEQPAGGRDEESDPWARFG